MRRCSTALKWRVRTTRSAVDMASAGQTRCANNVTIAVTAAGGWAVRLRNDWETSSAYGRRRRRRRRRRHTSQRASSNGEWQPAPTDARALTQISRPTAAVSNADTSPSNPRRRALYQLGASLITKRSAHEKLNVRQPHLSREPSTRFLRLLTRSRPTDDALASS